MPRILKDLTINEVSSVDRGAGEGVKVLLMKRDFTQDQRDQAADTGAALPDGSFPIKTAADLANAVQAFGRAKDPAKAKAHIIARARALGATDKLPADWKVSKALNPGEIEMTEAELQALVAKSAEEAVKKALEGVGKTQAEELAKRDREILLLKMTPAHKAYMGQCDETTQKAFTALDDKGRDDFMAKNPIRKAADLITIDDLAKRDQTVAKLVADNETLQKRLAASDLKEAQADFKKRAATMGLTQEGDGELMRKAYGGDAEAQTKFEARQAQVIKALGAQIDTSVIFSEMGTAKGATGDAYQELVGKASALREKDNTLSQEQAFAKVYTDPANAEIVKRQKVEENRARFQVVA